MFKVKLLKHTFLTVYYSTYLKNYFFQHKIFTIYDQSEIKFCFLKFVNLLCCKYVSLKKVLKKSIFKKQQ